MDAPETNEKKTKATISDLLLGRPRDLRDPRIFHTLSLIAFLAWVGLGSDGLSSSCYGPEEAFLALGHSQYLALFLALMTAITVFVISASYSQTIDLFPGGGGGYLVASRLLGPYPGVVSGSALVIDYVLTISVSIASGADAIFSLLPPELYHYKLILCLLVIALMVGMNLRGVKESVITLLPIFLAFCIMHIWLVGYALITRAPELPAVVGHAMGQARADIHAIGWIGMGTIFFRAYSMGGGTYTGIEAVSNGLPILREPKTTTGKRTMLYMAFSLAFIASGILIGYLLENVEPMRGKTLNAVMFDHIARNWKFAGLPVGTGIITFALITEGALLFVAAQTGFIDGPRVLSTMAHDRWLPRRLGHLSGRLVTQDGVLAMGIAAALTLIGTEAHVSVLVVLYAINVFVTFTLSQLGMTVHWWSARKAERRWKRKILINGVGCLFTFAILTLTLTLKFWEGGWVTVLITGGLIWFCHIVRRHYRQLATAIDLLEAQVLPSIYSAPQLVARKRDPDAPTAVLLVNGFNGLGLATLLKIGQLFPGEFHNVVIVSVAEIDSSLLRSHEDIEEVEKQVVEDLQEYCDFAARLGFHAETRTGLGADVVAELKRLCLETAATFPKCVFFAGKLIWENQIEGFLARFLHNHTALELQDWLQLYGYSLVILPMRVGTAKLPLPDGSKPAEAAQA